jgi:integrase
VAATASNTEDHCQQKALVIPELILELIGQHKVASRWVADTDFVFCRIDGTSLDPDHLRNQVLYKAMDAAGIPRKKNESGFHSLRHAAGSLLYDMHRDLEEVKTFLRHTRIGTTSDIYVHPSSKVSREAPEALAKLLLEPEQEVEVVH